MSQLDQLAKHRDAILLAEIGAWLHMLGKYDWQFIERHCGGNTSYDYQNFMSELATDYPKLFDLLDLNSSAYQNVLSALPITSPSSVGRFICDHHKTSDARQGNLSDQLTMLLVDAHGRGSNIEKSEIQSNNDFPSQSLPAVYLSSAFGFSKQLTSADYRTIALHNALDNLIHQILSSNNADKWVEFVKQSRQELVSHFQTALAETRLPFNDVTLLDQTASTVAFFKSAIAERVVAGSWEPLMNASANQYKWRTLSVPFAGLAYVYAVSGITDLLGRQNILFKAQDAVQTLLEVTYPIGQEIYRDEQSSLFLVPDEPDLLQWENSSGQNLEGLIQQEVVKVTAGDMIPDLRQSLMSQGTRTLYTIGQQINAASSMEITSDIEPIAKAWQGVTGQQVCTNCGLRPQGPSDKASNRKVCDLCLKRREDRSKTWATEQLDQTVWLDEVADSNGRLALIVGSWDLTEWLNGTLVNTIIAASSLNFTDLERNCRTSLQTTRRGNPQQFQGILTNLLNRHVRQQFNNQFRGYYNAIIQPEWQHLATTGLAEETIAAMHFVRQNPSFARLRRIWQTTQTFWETALDEPNCDGKLIIPQISHRLQIKGSLKPEEKGKQPDPYSSYDLKLPKGVKLSVVWDSDKKRFITCDNLDYLEKPELLGEPVREFLHGELTLEEPIGYGSKNKEWGKIIVQQAEPLPDSYTPIIPILAQPRTFMALVPADKAVTITKAIQTKYEREMGKVRNRLPLHLGLVYFHRRTPLRAALDAGRRMLKYEGRGIKNEVWTVKSVDPNGTLPNGKKELANGTQQFNKTVCVELEQNGRSLNWHVPNVMGDGVTPDDWYPYVFIKSDVSSRSRTFQAPRPKNDGTTEECWLIHAAELEQDDEIYFIPAILDFQWLDSTARRFEIAYDDNGRRRGHSIRPYLLDDLSTIQKGWELIGGSDGLSNSQIYALRDLIETKRKSWQPTAKNWEKDCQGPRYDGNGRVAEEAGMFWQFCHDAIVTAKWKKKPTPKQIDALTNWAVSSLLTDTIQLHMGIMKQKPQREDKNNE